MPTPEHVIVDLGEPLGPSSEPVVTRQPLTADELADFNARLAAEPARVAEAAKLTANFAALQQRARAALQSNAAFLALSPAQQQAQAVSHLALLTRECSALIRLILNLLEDLSGT
jgi:hypothetical protein